MMGRMLLFAMFFIFLKPAHCKVNESRLCSVFGETFEIAEKDLLEHILLKLRKMEATGELEKERQLVERRGKEMILHPKFIAGITRTQKIREYKFNPVITLTRNLADHKGKVFAHKGEQFNPLDKIKLSKPLLFIDGDDEKQINWALSSGGEHGKIVLVKGSPLDLQKRLARDIYFDQCGSLTTKLGIKHVPAIVFQKTGEKMLTIIEDIANERE